jgi:RNase P protein component
MLVLVARPNTLDLSRVGVAASRKLGKAVPRHLYPKIEAGWDVMLIARPRILAAKMQQVEEALGGLLEQSKLLAKERSSHPPEMSVLEEREE